MDALTIHGCEQVLRFSQVEKWDDLSEERKVQLGFNMGVMSHGLGLSKEEGYLALAAAREGTISMQEFRAKMLAIITARNVPVLPANIAKPF
jgi:hypothetical protein